ncbi:MAG: FAD-dependent oxidoreductase [bacterium]
MVSSWAIETAPDRPHPSRHDAHRRPRGFAGIYAVRELERLLGGDRDVEITLVNQDNYFVFTPLLHEVAASDLDLTHIVNPIRKLLRRAAFFHGNVLEIDLAGRPVVVSHGVATDHSHRLEYDHLALALGAVTNVFGTPRAWPSAPSP